MFQPCFEFLQDKEAYTDFEAGTIKVKPVSFTSYFKKIAQYRAFVDKPAEIQSLELKAQMTKVDLRPAGATFRWELWKDTTADTVKEIIAKIRAADGALKIVREEGVLIISAPNGEYAGAPVKK